MLRKAHQERILIILTLAFLSAGVVMVYSTSFIVAMQKFGDEYFFLRKHILYTLIGAVLFAVSSRIPYPIYKKAAYPILMLSLAMLLLVLIPGLGREAGGARRWLRMGPVTFQPSEFAKLAVVIFLAYSLEEKKEKIKSFSFGFLPNILIPGLVIALIMAEPDFGSAVTLFILVYIMNFIGGVRVRHLLGIFVLMLPALYLVVTRFSYMVNRILVFLDPWRDPTGKGWQMVQSFLAFGSGGVWGVGLGQGHQKLFYLPEAHTDFIFSVIGEELGLVGVVGVIVLYIMFLASGIKVAREAKDLHGVYLALGLTLMITLQALINMAVVLGILPPKGLPLPFISYGGSSLVASMLSVGIILNICIKGNEA
ncbi:MAG: putative lipid II flippase FtsW [Deltaproteobacteria bacterium]|nr:putative lipid II flippase FtsW [Deltaproteobacteria bacterium]